MEIRFLLCVCVCVFCIYIVRPMFNLDTHKCNLFFSFLSYRINWLPQFRNSFEWFYHQRSSDAKYFPLLLNSHKSLLKSPKEKANRYLRRKDELISNILQMDQLCVDTWCNLDDLLIAIADWNVNGIRSSMGFYLWKFTKFLLRCSTRPYESGTQWDSNSLV